MPSGYTLIIILVIVAAICPFAIAEQWNSASRAAHVYQRAMDYVSRFDTATGELFCWNARSRGQHLLTGYHAFGDTVWLDYTLKFLDELEKRMATGPDGYRGFIGPFIYNTNYWCDVHIGDSILCNMMLEFAEIVLADPQLKDRYGQRAQFYLDLVRRNLIEKWDSRQTWYEDGPMGGYRSWDIYGKPGEFTGWRRMNDPDLIQTRMSIPFNKSMDLAVACLSIYRMTGEKFYLTKAEKVFNWHRLRMQNYGGCMLWNYWEPLGPFDLIDDQGRAAHWMATHPYRNYQAGELDDIVAAYDMGLAYTEADIRRIIKTNLEIMWNGSRDKPEYSNSDVTLPGYKRAADSTHYPTRAGTLWTALLRFDPTIRELYTLRMKKVSDSDGNVFDDIDLAYFQKVICAEQPNFKRKYEPDAKVDQRPDSISGGQTVACALPMEFAEGESTSLLGKIPADGRVRVAVYDAAGEKLLATLFDKDVDGDPDGQKGVFLVKWDGSIDGHIKPGEYTVSWFYKGGRRNYPVNILEMNPASK